MPASAASSLAMIAVAIRSISFACGHLSTKAARKPPDFSTGAMRLVMVEALGRSPRPAPERVVEVLWRQIAAAVGIDADAAPAAPRRRSR